MSGRKQHFIPQVLLRGFARETRGVHRLWVHHRERGSFASNVQDVAASRDFYSFPGAAGAEPTLDDRITRHENRMASDLAFLRQAPPGPLARPEIARAVVTHLAFRTQAMRDLTGEAMVITQRLKAWMATPAVMLRFIGADGPRPRRAIRRLPPTSSRGPPLAGAIRIHPAAPASQDDLRDRAQGPFPVRGRDDGGGGGGHGLPVERAPRAGP